MSKISIIVFLFLVFSWCVESSTVESSKYEIVIKWKRTSWSCYQIEPYKMESSTSGKDCKEHCGKESQCLMAQFLKPFCYLSLVQSYDAFPCSKTSVLYMKVIKKKLIPPPTKPPTTKPITFEPTAKRTTESIETLGPTPKWVKNAEYCLELESTYNESKVKDEAECKLKCQLDEKCLVVEFRADQFVCKLSDQWRFKMDERCKISSQIFRKDLKNCPLHGEICQENAVCTNTSQTYQCPCKPGYELKNDGKCIKGDDITWKMHPSSCYFVTHFRKKVAFTLAECQDHCIQDNRCAMAQYQRPFCALTSDTTFRTFACEMESVLSIKVRKRPTAMTIPTANLYDKELPNSGHGYFTISLQLLLGIVGWKIIYLN